jgi:hypothetical protein
VVGLREDREALAPVEALDHKQLPERLVAIERLREHPPREPLELLLVARLRQRREPDVVADVEVRVVDPARPALAERDERQPLAVARNLVELRADRVDELLLFGRGAGERHHGGHVHVRAAVLEVQERRVEPGQAVRCHCSSPPPNSEGPTLRRSCTPTSISAPGTTPFSS